MASTLWRRASRDAEPLTASDTRSNWWPQVASLVALCWLAGVGALAVISALVSTTIGAAWPVTDNQWFYGPVERSGIAFNLGALALAVAVSVAVGAFRPAWWRRALLALAALPIPVLLSTSRNVLAGLAILALLLPACWLGREAARGFLRETDPATAWIGGGGIGVGLIAALGFGLGLVGLLRPQVLWPLLAVATLWLVATGRRRLRQDVVALGRWLRRPVGRSPLMWLLAAFALTFFWLNLFGALAPETASDAVRQRLPAAAHFAATGRLAADVPELAVAKDTAVGEATYAVALAVGPLQAAGLLAFATGILCAALVFGLGRSLGGPRAGAVAAAAFYTMPIVAFLSHTAYLDLFTTLYAVTAALILLRHERPDWRAAVVAGFCVGMGVGVTIRFGYVAVGLAVLPGLLALRRGGLPAAARLVALMAGAALLTAAAPLARSAILTGQVPGLALATASLTRGSGDTPTVMADLARFGIGRSPADLARLPFALTFHTDAFEWPPTPWGPFGRLIGYLFFGLGPLLVVARPRRRALALCAGVAVATLFWFYTVQYLRYGLPILAMFLPVAGLAYVSVRQGIKGAGQRAALGALVVVLAAAGVALQLRVPTYERDYVLGRQ
ncbi:MAG TPA: hypothetical protein VFW96_04940, partial [Thermomicrobiales bacterium]|nr:hypothetical protein [Thermomicrobiales bacterium]